MINRVSVAETTEADTPLIVTRFELGSALKFFPVIVTGYPIPLIEGENAVIDGNPSKVKVPEEVAVFPFSETVIFPLTNPRGTLIFICVAVELITVATTPFILTIFVETTGLKFVPVIVMVAPSVSARGEKPVIVGDDGGGGGGGGGGGVTASFLQPARMSPQIKMLNSAEKSHFDLVFILLV
jgi:hypothetical protein